MVELQKNEEKKETLYEKDQREHFEKFKKTVPSDSDPVTMILRCHLLAEYYLDRVITIQIPRGDIVIDSRMQFFDKLIIVEAFGVINKDLLDSLKKLNSVRNSCSHVIDYQISETDMDKIGSPLGTKYFKLKKKYSSDYKILLYPTLLMIIARFTGTVQDIMDKKFNEGKE